jgi:hypothetical protein
MAGVLAILKTGRLLAVDRFLELTMQERVAHVQLMDGPPFRGGESEDGTDGGRLDDRGEGLTKVHSWVLNIPMKDPPRLAALECAVGMKFVLKHPFAGDDADAGRSRDEAPCLVPKQSVVLLLHGLSLSVVTESNMDGKWDGGWLGDTGDVGVSQVRFDSAYT